MFADVPERASVTGHRRAAPSGPSIVQNTRTRVLNLRTFVLKVFGLLSCRSGLSTECLCCWMVLVGPGNTMETQLDEVQKVLLRSSVKHKSVLDFCPPAGTHPPVF